LRPRHADWMVEAGEGEAGLTRGNQQCACSYHAELLSVLGLEHAVCNVRAILISLPRAPMIHIKLRRLGGQALRLRP
jgi:hypothetical protein